MSVENQVEVPRKIESVLTSCAWGPKEDTDAYVTMWLNKGHLSILVAQPFNRPRMKAATLGGLLLGTFSIVATRLEDPRDEGEMPAGYFDELVEGCQHLFPRYWETPFSRYGYLYAALKTGNLSVIESFRSSIAAEENDTYIMVPICQSGKPQSQIWSDFGVGNMSRDEAKEKIDATLLADADRFFQAKKRVHGAWVLPPSKRVNGVLIEMAMTCAP